jgi:flavin-binding protein dodecin
MERIYKKIEILGASDKSFAEAAQDAVAKANITRTEGEGLAVGERR